MAHIVERWHAGSDDGTSRSNRQGVAEGFILDESVLCGTARSTTARGILVKAVALVSLFMRRLSIPLIFHAASQGHMLAIARMGGSISWGRVTCPVHRRSKANGQEKETDGLHFDSPNGA